jgi:hypothetical protein
MPKPETPERKVLFKAEENSLSVQFQTSFVLGMYVGAVREANLYGGKGMEGSKVRSERVVYLCRRFLLDLKGF